jgi:hypothetical protein
LGIVGGARTRFCQAHATSLAFRVGSAFASASPGSSGIGALPAHSRQRSLDFPDCVAGGKSQEEAIGRAETVLAQAVDALAERGSSLPEPTPIEGIALPKGCNPVAYFIVGVAPPDPSERVNAYLPKCLITRIDRRAAELGMIAPAFSGSLLPTR